MVMKKIFLLLPMLLSAFSTMADDGDIYDVYYNVLIDGIYYNLNNYEKAAMVTNNGKKDASVDYILPEGDSYSGDVVIPTSVTYNGETYSVTRIGIRAFYNCQNLISVEIPNSVTEIESRAFNQSSNLTSVKLPDKLKDLKGYVFARCSSLASIDIPKSVEFIDEGTFRSCTSLSSITIPNSVKYIEAGAFKDCTGLTSINIPNSVSLLGEQAFNGCSELASITIGEGLPVITYHTFWGCDKLESVTVLATAPPEFEWGDEAFTHYGTLHVRKGCKDAYGNALYWQNFNIVEDVDAVNDITNTETSELSLRPYNHIRKYINNGRVVMERNGKMLFSISGQRIE